MRKFYYLLAGIAVILVTIIACEKSAIGVDELQTLQKEEISAKKEKCTTIQSGEIVGSDGVTITTGYDQWGYNYQAMIFNGYYCDSYRNAVWCQDYKDVELSMKWNEAWLSNQDCGTQIGREGAFSDLNTPDGKLDRHYGFDSYRGSGAWITNHQKGTYMDGDVECSWNYFVKIVAAPADAYEDSGIWYNADGAEIGPVIWGQFAIIQEVENDLCAGIKGKQYGSPSVPGLGKF